MLIFSKFFFAGCPPSQYGPFCNQSCPWNCHLPCDLETGNCIFGCLIGWIGDTCEHGINIHPYPNCLLLKKIEFEINITGVRFLLESVSSVIILIKLFVIVFAKQYCIFSYLTCNSTFSVFFVKCLNTKYKFTLSCLYRKRH